MKYFNPVHDRLIQINQQATAAFWDQKWHDDEIGLYDPVAVHPCIALTRAFLPEGAQILEGGCGTAGKIAALQDAGYRVTGVDFAAQTVARVLAARPAFDIRVGDVFELPFPEAHFDGYWSFGVIEHFWTGYEGILQEAKRVLRPGGLLFLTFPTLSTLRRLKVRLGIYPKRDMAQERPDGFYQFLLNPDRVSQTLVAAGFQPCHVCRIQASHGLSRNCHACGGPRASLAPDYMRTLIGTVQILLNTRWHTMPGT